MGKMLFFQGNTASTLKCTFLCIWYIKKFYDKTSIAEWKIRFLWDAEWVLRSQNVTTASQTKVVSLYYNIFIKISCNEPFPWSTLDFPSVSKVRFFFSFLLELSPQIGMTSYFSLEHLDLLTWREVSHSRAQSTLVSCFKNFTSKTYLDHVIALRNYCAQVHS